MHILQRLQHCPNVVQLVDTFEDDTTVCLVMELLSGGDLQKVSDTVRGGTCVGTPRERDGAFVVSFAFWGSGQFPSRQSRGPIARPPLLAPAWRSLPSRCSPLLFDAPTLVGGRLAPVRHIPLTLVFLPTYLWCRRPVLQVGPFNERGLALVAQEVLKVIKACHEQGVLHGDVKPGGGGREGGGRMSPGSEGWGCCH